MSVTTDYMIYTATPVSPNWRTVLEHLHDVGPSTPFEVPHPFTDDLRHWGPTFTELKDAGLVERTGQRRETGLGGKSHEHRLTPAGQAVLESLVEA